MLNKYSKFHTLLKFGLIDAQSFLMIIIINRSDIVMVRRLFPFIFVYITLASAQVIVKEDSLFSTSLNATTKYTIILPASYAESTVRFPVLYLLHGYSGDHTNWVKLTRLVNYADQYQLIIVSPDGKNGWYTNSDYIPHAKFENSIIDDLIPHVDSHYKTDPSGNSRSIGGLSMGGYGAVKFALKHPSMFFFAAGISPAIQVPYSLEDSLFHATRSKGLVQSVRDAFGAVRNETWKINDVFYLAEKVHSDTLPYIYLAVGSQDGLTENIGETHRLAGTLRKNGIPFEMHETAGGHNWKFWDKEIEIVLRRINEVSVQMR
jgi:S-formylglutathione hydrolase FrmB